jgi:hypothetical protein
MLLHEPLDIIFALAKNFKLTECENKLVSGRLCKKIIIVIEICVCACVQLLRNS